MMTSKNVRISFKKNGNVRTIIPLERQSYMIWMGFAEERRYNALMILWIETNKQKEKRIENTVANKRIHWYNTDYKNEQYIE